MSLNKFMHPRNKYRRPPDFKALAIKYPEFRKYAQQDISGKVKLNFKNIEAVRALTTTLLKEDFDLEVEIPSSRLIPTLPLRLNYLLWIEDILNSNGKSSDEIKGIDIGCGASCVYPLLAAKKFQWCMLGTEVDMDSAFIASNNVRKNNLKSRVTVRAVEKDKMLVDVIDLDKVYDFCMCNPPFFGSTDELEPQNVSRSAKRPLPRNAHSGATHELVFEGGEIKFISRIIQDSLVLKEKIRVYTVMVGHKTSVGKVKQALHEAGVARVISTEFCQGHTTRWGLAWTLDDNVVLPEIMVPNSNKKKAPFTCNIKADIVPAVEKLKKLMDELQIVYSTLKNTDELVAMDIAAEKNTWAHSRKKRREEKMKQLAAKKPEISEVAPEIGKNKPENESGVDNKMEKGIEKMDEDTHTGGGSSLEAVEVKKNGQEVNVEANKISDVKEANKQSIVEDFNMDCSDNSGEISVKRLKLENSPQKSVCQVKKEPRLQLEPICSSESAPGIKKDPFLHASLVIKKHTEGATLEISWLRGGGGRDSAHQLLFYFKNNFETIAS